MNYFGTKQGARVQGSLTAIKLLSVVGLIGFGRLFQLALIGGAGYFFYRLVNQQASSDEPDRGPTAEDLHRVPST